MLFAAEELRVAQKGRRRGVPGNELRHHPYDVNNNLSMTSDSLDEFQQVSWF